MAASPRNPATPEPGSSVVTVRSIAKAANVSIGSVSSVLNNRHVERRISPDTVERIKAAALRLGYLPNIGARRLRSGVGSSRTLVLALITSFEAPLSLVNHFVSGLREVAQDGRDSRAGESYLLLIDMFSAGRLSELPGLTTGAHFNAAIITNTTMEDDAFLARTPLPYPVVLVNRLIPGYASVTEHADCGKRAAEILFERHRKRLVVLYGRPLTQITKTRVESFRQHAAQLTGNEVPEIVAADLTEGAAAEAMTRFLQDGNHRIDGLYTVTDGEALGAYHAIREAGKRVPADIAVIGVGDYDISPYFDPPLSTVGVPHSELGRAAARLLLQQLRNPGLPRPGTHLDMVQHLRASTHGSTAPGSSKK